MIPDSVTTIGESAFRQCENLANVTIEKSVATIQADAFYRYSSLTSIAFKGNAPGGVVTAGYRSTFPETATLYYIAGKSSWTTPTWKGYHTVPVIGTGDPGETHTDGYYAKQPNYLLRFTDNTGSPLSSVSVEIGGQSFSSDFGDSIDISEPDNNFLSKFKLKFDLPKEIKAPLSIEPDGTVLATLGVEVSEEKKFCPAAKTIDALCHTDNYPKDWDSFIGALKGNIIPQSSSFGITLDRKVIGYLEGKLVREANGSLGILVTEGKIAVSFEGKEK